MIILILNKLFYRVNSDSSAFSPNSLRICFLTTDSNILLLISIPKPILPNFFTTIADVNKVS